MYKFWFDYVKPKYGEKPELCNMDRDILYTQKQTLQRILKQGLNL